MVESERTAVREDEDVAGSRRLHELEGRVRELERLLGHPDKVFQKPFVLACSIGPDDDIEDVFSSIANWFRAKADLRRWIKSCDTPRRKRTWPNCVAAIEIARNEIQRVQWKFPERSKGTCPSRRR